MRRIFLLPFIIPILLLGGCERSVTVIEHPPLDWSINAQRLRETGCVQPLQESCPELAALGCDEIGLPSFYLGGLQPPLTVLECVHARGEPPNRQYFKQPAGLDNRYRSFVIFQDGAFRLIIKKSEFKEIFAPVESADEALSYAMAISSLGARFDIDPNANVEYLVKEIEETHVSETPDGYLVRLFDWSHKMGCDTHTFYAVDVLVTREGDVREVAREAIYKGQVCFDFDRLTLDD